MKFKSFQKNTAGNDYAVGDIHGCFTKLQRSLESIGFDESVDRLFSVGDLVDRGPESHLVLDWMSKPWFHPVRGNHDDFAIRHVRNGKIDPQNYIRNGGAWFLSLSHHEQEEIASALETMPLAIEIECDSGIVGVVHAECPYDNWEQFKTELLTPQSKSKSRAVDDWCMWARERIEGGYDGEISGLKFLIVGHTPVDKPVKLGNVIYIDTMGWRPNGEFTIYNLNRTN